MSARPPQTQSTGTGCGRELGSSFFWLSRGASSTSGRSGCCERKPSREGGSRGRARGAAGGVVERSGCADAGSEVRPRSRRRPREQGSGERARQPERAELQPLRQAVRGALSIRRRRASEPPELPRAGLGLDPRRPERLHDVPRLRAEPGGLARAGAPHLEGVRGGAPATRLDGRVLRALREEARAVPLLPGRRLEAFAAPPDRAAPAALAGSRLREAARVLA